MMNFSQLKISTKLVAAFGFMVLLLALMGAVTYAMTSSVEHSMGDITERQTPIIKELGNLRDEVNLQARLTLDTIIFTDPAQVESHRQRLAKSRDSVKGILDALSKQVLSTEGRRLEVEMVELRKNS